MKFVIETLVRTMLMVSSLYVLSTTLSSEHTLTIQIFGFIGLIWIIIPIYDYLKQEEQMKFIQLKGGNVKK